MKVSNFFCDICKDPLNKRGGSIHIAGTDGAARGLSKPDVCAKCYRKCLKALQDAIKELQK